MEGKEGKEEVAEGKSGGKSGGDARFVIKKWNAVVFWSWDICTDTCAICRNALYEPSIEAQASECLDSSKLGRRPVEEGRAVRAGCGCVCS